MNFFGLILGIIIVLVIGLSHSLIIKGEYYWGTKWWLWLLIAGLAFLLGSLLVKSDLLSGIFGIISFCLFWGITELFKQKQRVEKGWFPKNPKRKQMEHG